MSDERQKSRGWLSTVGPGLLVAATGVGAGDLATASFTGSHLGTAVLWAVAIGAFLKFVLNEGLTRWQLATGDTLLEGCVKHLGRPFRWLFLVYFLLWSYCVGAALMSATGVTLHAIRPWFGAANDKAVYGIASSALALALCRIGGYRLFEKLMTVCIGVMFVVVVGTAVALKPSAGEILSGLTVPHIPQLSGDGLGWTIALVGGVGGTLTVLCYGYWIREENRTGADDLRTCRIDLATGYLMTALFGMAMLVIGSRMGELPGKGATLLVELSNSLVKPLGSWGPALKWAFLIGAFGAVFSSLLGVWQSVPYLFADFWRQAFAKRPPEGEAEAAASVDTNSIEYRSFQIGLAVLPMIGLIWGNFEAVQKTYAIAGALTIPFLAVVLLYLNNRTSLIGAQYRNSVATNVVLGLACALSVWAGWLSF